MTSTASGRLWGARPRDWADIQEGMVSPVYRAVFDRVGVANGTRYLDVGCGAGMAAQLAAARGARVAGLDAAEPLLVIARERVPDGDFREGDIEILPFPDRSFDLVTGFNSFQYAGNPVVALSEAGRVVAADGTVVVVIWGSPEGMEAVAMIGALGSLLPPPPPGTPGPFALSEEVALRQFAVDAGLRPLAVFDVDCPFVYPDETTAVRGFASTGVAARAMELTSEQAVQKAFADAVAAFRQPDGSYRIGASFRCLLARP
jgi:SAM-dependent methyltransferase